MAKPRIPSQKSRYASLNQRLNKYLLLVQQIFDGLNLEAAKAATSVSYDGSKPFRFSDYPTLKKRVGDLQQRYVDDIGAVIYSGTSSEWKKSNEVQDLLADGVLKAYGAQVNGSKYKVYYQTNNDALKAFQTRRANGMTLSQKLWNQSKNYREEMEYAISSAIEKGTSAVTLSKRLSKYLHDFPSLQKDYKEKYGKAVDCHDCEYRSMRLARSEINMAYRTAEQERWSQMDFVVGYEIKLSGSHPAEDICDMLKGKYPKDFVWTGWHPSDLCYKIPILKTEEEFWNYGEAKDKPSSREVTDVPDAFKKWVVDNEARINAAQRRGTLPFFLKDNPLVIQERGLWKDILDMRKMAISVGGEVQGLAESIAEQFGGVVTPINYKSFGSIARKCKTEGCSPFELKDVVRNTIIVDADKIEDVLSALESQGNVLRIKRQTPDQFMGYSGNIVNITTINGTVAEIQVNTAKMIYAKETPAVAKSILGEDVWNRIAKETGLEGGLGHKFYEQFRVLDKMSPKALEIERLSREYYSHFQPQIVVEQTISKAIVEDLSGLPTYWKDAFKDMTSDEIFKLMSDGKVANFAEFCKITGLSQEQMQSLFGAVIDHSDVYMSIDGNTLLNKIIKGDRKFKSSMETGTGTFTTIGAERAVTERKIFGLADDCSLNEYPKYGFLAGKGQMSYERIVGWGYGDVYVCFDKSKIATRSTLTVGDSYANNRFTPKEYLRKKIKQIEDEIRFGWDETKIPALKKELNELEGLLAKDTAWEKVAPATRLSAPDARALLGRNPEAITDVLYQGIDALGDATNQYVECQIYGTLSLDDVSRIEVASKKQKLAIEKALRKNGIDIEVVPAKYDQRVTLLEEGFTRYDGDATIYAHSLQPSDVDRLGDYFVDGLSKRFADSTSAVRKYSSEKFFEGMDDFVTFAEKIKDGSSTVEERRTFLKMFYEEMQKGKKVGRFPKEWYEHYRKTFGGWTDDLLNPELLKR